MSDELRGADIVARALRAAGIGRIFTLSGNHVMSVFDATLDADLELTHVRHEGAAVHMADAWARLTGEVGVALVTGGPGHANAVSALYTAMASESPLVLLSGHAPIPQLGTGAFQELAQADMAAPVTKASWVAGDVRHLGADIARAIRLAYSGRPGPVHVSLPTDVLESVVASPHSGIPVKADFSPARQPLNPDTAGQLLSAFAGARRPLILMGPLMGSALGRKWADELRSSTSVPAIVMESPRGINDPSLGAFAQILAEADCIALLGKQADFTLGFARTPVINANCIILLIDADPDAYARAANAFSQLSNPVQAVTAATIPAAKVLSRAAQSMQWPDSDWQRRVQSAIAYRPADWRDIASEENAPLHPVEVCRAVQSILDAHPEAVLVVDGGEFGQWAQACLTARHRIINGPAGAIGSALPFAVAARMARREAPVIAMLGDGTVGFHLSEFDTAVRYGLPFVAVVGNDACWNAEYQIQLRNYGAERLVACELQPTRYDKVVQALGGYGEQVGSSADLPKALQNALQSGKPACVNVPITRTPAPVLRQ